LPNGLNYYCFHNEPKDLWSFPDKITESDYKSSYIFDNKTIGVIQGHLHLNKVDNFNPKRIVLGQLCGSNHHKPEEKSGNNLYLLFSCNSKIYISPFLGFFQVSTSSIGI